jgi:hypothetical protein
MTLVLADPVADTTPMPVVPARVAIPTGDVAAQRSSLLVVAEALRHADDLRLPDGGKIPGPTAIGVDATGRIELVMPDLESVLAWQVLLRKPKVRYVDPQSATIAGTREGWDWLVRTAAR